MGYLSSALEERPFAIPLSCIALEGFENGLKQAVISSVSNPETDGDTLAHGDDEKDALQNQQQIGRFLNVLHGDFHPDTVGVVLNAENVQLMKEEVNEMYGYYHGDKEDNVMAYVCRDFACLAPTADAEEFAAQLRQDGNGNNDGNGPQ